MQTASGGAVGAAAHDRREARGAEALARDREHGAALERAADAVAETLVKDGLVHVSELSWKHVDHPSSVVTVGDEIDVEVLEVDLDRERISLSLKATQEDPWQVFARTHAIGQIAPGKVTKLVPFGAFVRVADGIEGLVHISELSGKHVELAEQGGQMTLTGFAQHACRLQGVISELRENIGAEQMQNFVLVSEVVDEVLILLIVYIVCW